MKNRINPLGRAVLAAAVVAIMIGATATAFADDDQGHRGYYGYGGEDHDWHEHHEGPPVYYYQPGYAYRAPPPVVYAPPPQYAPPIDLFFSIGIH